MRFEKMKGPAGKHGRFHRANPGCFSCCEPFVQSGPGSIHSASLKCLALRAFDAVADGFLVDVESDVLHSFHGSLLLGLTWGDLRRPFAHYELSAFRRLLLSTYSFKQQ